MVLVEADVLQEYVVAPAAVNVAVDPEHIVALLTVTVGVALTVTVAVFTVLQPPEVPVTV
jgi:hypothetical protein